MTGPSSGSPARYLDPDDRILSVKAGAPIPAMFVLCVHMPGPALLEAIDSIRQNVRRIRKISCFFNPRSSDSMCTDIVPFFLFVSLPIAQRLTHALGGTWSDMRKV